MLEGDGLQLNIHGNPRRTEPIGGKPGVNGLEAVSHHDDHAVALLDAQSSKAPGELGDLSVELLERGVFPGDSEECSLGELFQGPLQGGIKVLGQGFF